jgi:hypothetical protein
MTNGTGVEDFPYFYAPNAHDKLTMPVEFSVAAYRVGHTMVRSVYAVNGQNLDVELFDERFATLGFSNYPRNSSSTGAICCRSMIACVRV